jgi:hypothetical protein
MFAYLPGQGPLRRLAAALAVVTCGLLASAAVVPAAFAQTDPGGFGGVTRHAAAPAAIVRVVTAGGMAGWQISLIAAGAATLGAAAAVLVDRLMTARRAASSPTL